jgi:hypothetical protein
MRFLRIYIRGLSENFPQTFRGGAPEFDGRRGMDGINQASDSMGLDGLDVVDSQKCGTIEALDGKIGEQFLPFPKTAMIGVFHRTTAHTGIVAFGKNRRNGFESKNMPGGSASMDWHARERTGGMAESRRGAGERTKQTVFRNGFDDIIDGIGIERFGTMAAVDGCENDAPGFSDGFKEGEAVLATDLDIKKNQIHGRIRQLPSRTLQTVRFVDRMNAGNPLEHRAEGRTVRLAVIDNQRAHGF